MADMDPVSQGREFDSIGRQLNVAARATRALLDAVLADAGTTFSSWMVLAALHNRGPAIQKDLARSLDMIGPSVVERIDALERAGLVTRSPVPDDRRAMLIEMTDDGRALFARLHTVMQQTEAALTEGLDPRDLDTVRRLLDLIAARAKTLRGKLGNLL
jgi:MarR family transcriptional regulator, transcriptional regulator for hemolysin